MLTSIMIVLLTAGLSCLAVVMSIAAFCEKSLIERILAGWLAIICWAILYWELT